MIKRVVEIDRFNAASDAGVTYTLIVYQDMIDASSQDSPDAELPGRKHLTTSGGLTVNYIDAKTFKIVQTDEVIRKIG